jgi:hypothetical protein
MQKLFICTTVALLFANLYSYALSAKPVAEQSEQSCTEKAHRCTDIVHLGGAIILDRIVNQTENFSEYKVKWNQSRLLSVPGKQMTDRNQVLFGGVNQAKSPKHLGAMISMTDLRNIPNAVEQIAWVKVNGQSRQFSLVLPGKEWDAAVQTVQTRFTHDHDRQLLQSLHPDAPLLLIDGGIVQPNQAIKFEYELKERCCIAR